MKSLKLSHLSNTSEQFFENPIEDLLSPSELAKKLKCSISYIKKLRRMKVIHPAISRPRFVRYRLSEVIVALQKRSLL